MASRSWNRVQLIGNLTRDPEMRYTPSGSAVATFTIATNRTYVSDGEKKEEADFHRIVAWTKLAELCVQLLKKGSKVFVSGRLQNRSWEGQDGITRQTTEIVIEDMIVLSPRNGLVSSPEYSDEVPPAAPSSQAAEKPSVAKEPQEKPEQKEAIKKSKTKEDKTAETEEKETVSDDDLPF